MALPVSLFLDTLVRCSRNQVSNATTSGRLRSVRTPTRRDGAARVNLALDGKQRIDARNRLAGDRRLVEPSQIEELAPGMGPTGGLDDWSWLAGGFVEAVEPGIGIRLHQPGEACQMLLGMFAATVVRIEEHRCRRPRTGKGPVVADIGP